MHPGQSRQRVIGELQKVNARLESIPRTMPTYTVSFQNKERDISVLGKILLGAYKDQMRKMKLENILVDEYIRINKMQETREKSIRARKENELKSWRSELPILDRALEKYGISGTTGDLARAYDILQYMLLKRDHNIRQYIILGERGSLGDMGAVGLPGIGPVLFRLHEYIRRVLDKTSEWKKKSNLVDRTIRKIKQKSKIYISRKDAELLGELSREKKAREQREYSGGAKIIERNGKLFIKLLYSDTHQLVNFTYNKISSFLGTDSTLIWHTHPREQFADFSRGDKMSEIPLLVVSEMKKTEIKLWTGWSNNKEFDVEIIDE